MDRSSWHRKMLYQFVLIIFVVHFTACGSDDTTAPEIELVTVAGMVNDIDTLVPAKGIRVWLLDTNYSDEFATGDDGAFALEVPKGSPLILVTDDFSTTKTNDWVPLINVEHPPMVASADIQGWVIHACPLSVGTELGSVAALDNYLANGDETNGDLFVPTASAAAGGTILVVPLGCDTEEIFASSADFSISIEEPEFPEGFMIGEKFWGPDLVPDPALCPDIMYPGDRTLTDFWGLFVSFGHPRFGGTEVTLTITDTDPERQYNWFSPVTVPVRSGWYSLLLPGHIDGVENIRVTDYFSSGCI